MKLIAAIVSVFLFVFTVNGASETEQKYIFFLHNKWIEDHDLDVPHPKYGLAEYNKITTAFETEGFYLISEKRKANTDVKTYAGHVVKQIDSLLNRGVAPGNITVVGTSKGGMIAQYVSTLAKNPELKFVFIGASFTGQVQSFPDINPCGKILNIFEKSDEGSFSFQERIEATNGEVTSFEEIELSTGKQHGFLFPLLNEWFRPTVTWASRE